MRRLMGAPPPRRCARRRLAGVLAALVLAGPALLGAAIGPGGPAAPAEPGGSGETVSLSGNGPGERLDVTLTRVVDPATPAGPVPVSADRLVAVQFRLENTGSAVYHDSPARAAHLLDADGHRFTGSDAATTAGPAFPDTVTLRPGGSALGFVAFRLPQDARPAAAQFALNGGLADDVGHWSLS
ncbi:hypothetical protein AB0953_26860 [Streptomyces sp. NPDC046866]|uniref:hypothetical protein n=1 Tax=Streptomyces sp. NPDC046866 TaxID=3154921 RepID=UPI0034571BAC